MKTTLFAFSMGIVLLVMISAAASDVEARVSSLEQEVRRLSSSQTVKQVAQFKAQLELLDKRMDKLEKRYDQVEQAVQDWARATKRGPGSSSVTANLRDFERWLQRTERAVQDILRDRKQTDRKLSDIEKRVRKLESNR